MQKHFVRAVVFITLFALLVVPSMATVSQAVPVSIMILDRFTPSMLGLDPDTESAEFFYNNISSFVNDDENDDLIQMLANSPQAGYDELRSNATISQYISDYQEGFVGRIQAEVEETGASGENCIGYMPGLRIDAAGIYYIDGAGGPSGEPHGVLVSETMTDIVDAVPYQSILSMTQPEKDALADPATVRPMDYTITVQTLAPTPITVVEADTDNFLLSSITQKIQDVIGSRPPGLWVINASFVVVPCDDLPELATLEGLIRVLYAAHRSNVANLLGALDLTIGEFVSLTHTSTELVQGQCGINPEALIPPPPEVEQSIEVPPVIEYVSGDITTEIQDCLDFETTVANAGIFVAAAGNSGLPYPFYPASAPHIISVSATKENEPFFATMLRDCSTPGTPVDELCSNAGEVLMPGWVERGGETYFGTSFAAPRMTLRTAVYLAHHNGDSCGLLDIKASDVLLTFLPGVIPCDELELTRNQVFQD